MEISFSETKYDKKYLSKKKSGLPTTNSNDIESSDDDVPLAIHKLKIQGKIKTDNALIREDILKRNNKGIKKTRHIKSDKRKRKLCVEKPHLYKNGKKVFCRSESESSDFEKYSYFDESKTKRKVKLPPNLSLNELIDQIERIKIENACLTEERRRIDQIKLKERLKLRLEIGRLKTCISELKLPTILINALLPDTGNTTNFINALNNLLKNFDFCNVETNEKFINKLNCFQNTNSTFWQEFNSLAVKSKEIHSTPFWIGKLDKIDPNNEDSYFKPDNNILNILKINESLNLTHTNLAYSSTNLDVAPSIENKTCQNELSDSSDDSTESFTFNSDWNLLATNKKIKRQLQALKIDNENRRDEDVEGDQENLSPNESDYEITKNQKLDVQNYDSYTQNDHSVKSDDNSVIEDNLCTECGFDSSWSSFIVRHREAFKNNTKLAPCNSCNMRFLKSGHFDGHHRLKRLPSKNIRPRTHICDICGQGCTTRSGLSQHRTRHAEAMYPCPHCSYKCRRQAYLKKHIEIHLKNMDADKKSHSNSYQFLNNKNIDNYQNQEMFHCQYCTYKTAIRDCFESHLKYHDKDMCLKSDQYYRNGYELTENSHTISSVDTNFLQL